MKSSRMILACSSERPSKNSYVYLSKSSIRILSCGRRPSLCIRRFYATATTGVQCTAFLVSRLL
jgi:hypothetical protein